MKLAGDRRLGRNNARKFLDVGVEVGEIRLEKGLKNAKLYYLIESTGGGSEL
jgi:hypothetical protein